VEQVENRISGLKDKVEESEHSDKDTERILRKYKWNRQDLWDNIKI
jgi:hypothetical protein